MADHEDTCLSLIGGDCDCRLAEEKMLREIEAVLATVPGVTAVAARVKRIPVHIDLVVSYSDGLTFEHYNELFAKLDPLQKKVEDKYYLDYSLLDGEQEWVKQYMDQHKRESE